MWKEPRRGPRNHEKAGLRTGQSARTKISTRNIPLLAEPGRILNSQLKEIWIDTELNIIDTAQWYPKIIPQGLYDRCRADRGRS